MSEYISSSSSVVAEQMPRSGINALQAAESGEHMPQESSMVVETSPPPDSDISNVDMEIDAPADQSSSPFALGSMPTTSEVMISGIASAILSWQMQHPMETGTIDWDAVAALVAEGSGSNRDLLHGAAEGFVPSASSCRELWESVEARIPHNIIQPLEELFPRAMQDDCSSSSLLGPVSISIVHPLTRPDSSGDDPCVSGLIVPLKPQRSRAAATAVVSTGPQSAPRLLSDSLSLSRASGSETIHGSKLSSGPR